MSTPYQPSNGSEGMWFTDKYCMNCLHCDPNPEGKKQCEILCASMCFGVGEEGYPKEWVYNEKDEPTCTKFKRWDWEAQGDPDDPENENYIQPDNPNQIKLF